MIALLAALLIQTPPIPPPVTVGIRVDPVTQCVEVWRAGELVAEYEPRDGEVYRELKNLADDANPAGRKAPVTRYLRPGPSWL